MGRIFKFDKDVDLSLAKQELAFLNSNQDIIDKEKQKKCVEKLEQENILTEAELDIVKKGRNAKMHRSKNNDIVTYHKATGFECLIGYLYQNDKNRLNEIMEKIL